MDIFSLIALSKAKNAESKSIGVYHYKGSVATESALPSQDNVQGDVWNIVDTSTYGPAGTNVAWDGAAWDALGGMAPVTSVNSQTGAVVLDAADVGAAEAFLVTVTKSDDDTTYTADKTINEIIDAQTAGKELWVQFPVPVVYSGMNVDVNVTTPLVPLRAGLGATLGYVAFANMRNFGATAIDHYQLSIFSHGVTFAQTALTSDATPQALGTASAGTSLELSRADHVHPKPSASDIGAEPAVTEVTVSTAGAVTQALDAGKMYHFTGALTSLTLTLNAAASGQLSQYHFDFTTGSSAPTVTLPSSVIMPDNWNANADMRYEVDILNNYAVIVDWAVSA